MWFIRYSALLCVGRSNLVVRALNDFVIGLLIRFSTIIFTNKYVTLLKSFVWVKDPLATKLRLNCCRRAVCNRPYLIANFIINFSKKTLFKLVMSFVSRIRRYKFYVHALRAKKTMRHGTHDIRFTCLFFLGFRFFFQLCYGFVMFFIVVYLTKL